LVRTLSLSPTQKGRVEASIKADNANFYSILFETPTGFVSPTMKGNTASYTYADTGWFVVKFRAHVSAAQFSEIIDSVHIQFNSVSLKNGYQSPESYAGYRLVWADEFNTNALDLGNWSYETGTGQWGWGNNELQYYHEGEKNAVVGDGKLTITAKKESAGGAQYTSARLITRGKKEFQYGRIDIRARLPKGQGLWPALWMLGSNIGSVSWPACGEIDIMELVGQRPNEVLGAAHWGSSVPSTFNSKKFRLTVGDFSDSFFVYSILWQKDKIEWFVNESKYHTITPLNTGSIYPFNNPFFFIFNIAVGGNLPGSPDATTRFPQNMEVDYIRVFQVE
jgi:beta-glucanase (GH16 family)